MSIDKDLLDRLMEGRSPGDLFGKTGILAELTKALAERALSTEIDVHLDEERAEEAPEGQNQPPPIAATGAARRRLPPTAARLSWTFLVTAMAPSVRC